PRSIPDWRYRRGAADLLDGARLCDTGRRGLCRADDVQLRLAWGGSTARQDRCDAVVHRSRRNGGAGAGVSVLAARRGSRTSALELARDLLDGAGRRRAAEGTIDPDVRRVDDRHTRDPRPVGDMAVAATAGMG